MSLLVDSGAYVAKLQEIEGQYLERMLYPSQFERWSAIDSHTPVPRIERAYANLDQFDFLPEGFLAIGEDIAVQIMLHRITSDGEIPKESLHTHPWPLAVSVREGRYEMFHYTMGQSIEETLTEADIRTFAPGDHYEMNDANDGHLISVVHSDEIYSVCLVGREFEPKNPNTPVSDKTTRNKQDDLRRARLLDDFRRALL